MKLIKEKEDKKVYTLEKNGLTYIFTVHNLGEYVHSNTDELYNDNSKYWMLTQIIALNNKKEKVYEVKSLVGESGNYVDLRLKKDNVTRSITMDDDTNTIISDAVAYKGGVYYSEKVTQNPYTIKGLDNKYFEENINFVNLLDNSKFPIDNYPGHDDILYFLAANNLFQNELSDKNMSKKIKK